MRARIITAIIGLPLLLLCCYIGGWLLALLCAALAVVAAYEMDKIFIRHSFIVNFPLDALAALLIAWTFGLILRTVWPFAIAILIIILTYTWWAHYKKETLLSCIARTVAVFYIGIGFGAILALRLNYGNWLWVLLAFLNVWITDTTAHLVGSRYGRNKLAPRISPHKTLEGALAGLIAAAFICPIYMALFLHLPYFTALPLAILFSVAAQLGDLLESALKRWAGIKDSGQIFPGHGGVLDRFDSLMLSAPLVLFLLSSL
ncbi:MAG: phosphatidate cytidylyltransferase [Firmicutes bacterium]|nr:phosphatidate cytidylyltransferase [Bacillota bacterium]